MTIRISKGKTIVIVFVSAHFLKNAASGFFNFNFIALIFVSALSLINAYAQG